MSALTKADLEAMREIDIHEVDPDTLADMDSVQVNMELPQNERILDFIRQIKNPYICRCGGLIVKSVFPDTDVTLTDSLTQYLRMMEE